MVLKPKKRLLALEVVNLEDDQLLHLLQLYSSARHDSEAAANLKLLEREAAKRWGKAILGAYFNPEKAEPLIAGRKIKQAESVIGDLTEEGREYLKMAKEEMAKGNYADATRLANLALGTLPTGTKIPRAPEWDIRQEVTFDERYLKQMPEWMRDFLGRHGIDPQTAKGVVVDILGKKDARVAFQDKTGSWVLMRPIVRGWFKRTGNMQPIPPGLHIPAHVPTPAPTPPSVAAPSVTVSPPPTPVAAPPTAAPPSMAPPIPHVPVPVAPMLPTAPPPPRAPLPPIIIPTPEHHPDSATPTITFPYKVRRLDGKTASAVYKIRVHRSTPINRGIMNFPHWERAAIVYNLLKETFEFPSEEDAKVWMAALLVKDGSIVLKGVPGTGKTTLAEITAMLIANELDYTRDQGPYSYDEVSKFLKNGGTYERLTAEGKKESIEVPPAFGIARMNPDKTPDEIFYRTSIGVDEYEEEPAAKANPTPTLKGIPLELITRGKLVKSTVYQFEPEVRAVVKAPIKLFNEANRMNKTVQDAALSLLAEKEVEYLGKTFSSPAYGEGQLTILDYNPHLDWDMLQELDRAFLDRIDFGIYLPALPLHKKRAALEARFAIGGANPRLVVLSKLNKVEVIPLSYSELQEIWFDVQNVKTEDVLITIAVLTQLFSISYRQYGDHYKRGKEIDLPARPPNLGLNPQQQAKFAPASTQFIDTSTVTYGPDSLKDHPLNRFIEAERTPGGTTAFSAQELLNMNERPLAFRVNESLTRLAQAYEWVTAAITMYEQKKKGMAPAFSPELVVRTETIVKLLPYVTDHRINLGVAPEFKTVFMSFGDFVRHMLIPIFIQPNEKKFKDFVVGYKYVKTLLDIATGKAPTKSIRVTGLTPYYPDTTITAGSPPPVDEFMRVFDAYIIAKVIHRHGEYFTLIASEPVFYSFRVMVKEEVKRALGIVA